MSAALRNSGEARERSGRALSLTTEPVTRTAGPLPEQQLEYFTLWQGCIHTGPKPDVHKFPCRFSRPDVVLETVRRLNAEEEEQEERQGYCEGRYFVWSEPAGERTRT